MIVKLFYLESHMSDIKCFILYYIIIIIHYVLHD